MIWCVFVDVDFPGMLLNLKIMAHKEFAEFLQSIIIITFITQLIISIFYAWDWADNELCLYYWVYQLTGTLRRCQSTYPLSISQFRHSICWTCYRTWSSVSALLGDVFSLFMTCTLEDFPSVGSSWNAMVRRQFHLLKCSSLIFRILELTMILLNN